MLVSWENEALMVAGEFGKGRFDIVYPPRSILAEPPVALVDKYADEHGTRAVAPAICSSFTRPRRRRSRRGIISARSLRGSGPAARG